MPAPKVRMRIQQVTQRTEDNGNKHASLSAKALSAQAHADLISGPNADPAWAGQANVWDPAVATAEHLGHLGLSQVLQSLIGQVKDGDLIDITITKV